MIARVSKASGRAALLAAGVAAFLAGCAGPEKSSRHFVPLPAKLLAEMQAKGMSPADPILIRIHKKESELEVWKRDASGRYALLKTYPMCRWSGQLGPKLREGDRQAPEGFYSVTPAQMNPNSSYHLSFNLGYPNALERAEGRTGSALMVHGACTSAGCYAMGDEGIREIYALAREAFAGGQGAFQVQALPFRMRAETLARYRANPNFGFWKNLKEGADHFDATRRPPRIAACGRRYVFDPREGSGPFEADAPCPAYEIDPDVKTALAEHRSNEDSRLAQGFAAQGFAAIAASGPSLAPRHVDGGMHPSFRAILRSGGPERLQALTSGSVPISSPDAALADPYSP